MIKPVVSQTNKDQPEVVTVPFTLDHNRMLVEAEFQRKDGSWFNALLWVDTGNPEFLISESFARDLGIEIDTSKAVMEIAAPSNVRIGGMAIDFDSVKTSVGTGIQWLFNTMHNDGNLPSTVLKKYHVVFDYPKRQFTIAEPGKTTPRGIRSPATINPVTGIIQLEAVIDGEKYSFALDNGASFSFVSDSIVKNWVHRHPDWPTCHGAAGCANIWGYWPMEGIWPLVRLPEIRWGNVKIRDVAMVGLPPIFRGKSDVGTWYSRKTARPVNGFLGPNVFKDFRVEIDYSEGSVYFENGAESAIPDMVMVGLTLQPLNDGRYKVIGIVKKNDEPVVEGIKQGDILLQIGDLKTTGATMGAVIDALRGNPGDIRVLKLERDGKPFTVKANVEIILQSF
jgi:hypothetical protein